MIPLSFCIGQVKMEQDLQVTHLEARKGINDNLKFGGTAYL